ncbi:hypothetical protein LUZ60_004224 [Juncus effusus]|nr:hypothetical protein LUZ60_004224 [Juncus effusus]
MDRRSWLWRRKSQEKSSDAQSQFKIYTIDQEGLRVGSNYETPKSAKSIDYSSILLKDENEFHEIIKDLNEKLNDAISTINGKEELLKKHTRVAEEAVEGWEQSQTEIETLKLELETSLQNNLLFQNQIENQQITQKKKEERFQLKANELESYKLENNKYIKNLEKENSDLKAKLNVLSNENNLLAKNAEATTKQYLESVKKANKLENKCVKLENLLHKNELNNDKNGTRKITIFSVEIELMHDFLEMERLISLLEAQNSNKELELRAKIEKFERQKLGLDMEIEKLHEKEKLLREKIEKEIRLREDTKSKLQTANFKIMKLKNELDDLNEKIKEEKSISAEFETKYEEIEAWITKINGESKLKQEKENARSAKKSSECQNTIASINKQLNFLANFDKLMEDNDIPDFIQDPEDVDYGYDDKIIHAINS